MSQNLNRRKIGDWKVGNVPQLLCYNGLGQRVQKSGPAATYLAWDEAGQVIGVYDGATTVQETVYLGRLPVAEIKAGVAYSIDTDQIGAPRVIRNLAGQEVWRWDTDAFGAAAANANPSGAGAFAYNPRFPGQFYDAESGKHYNGFRDYDPVTGRYVQSDPLGLQGGINTYTYVLGNPVSFTDPEGLQAPGVQQAYVQAQAQALWSYFNHWINASAAAGAALVTPAVPGAAAATVQAARYFGTQATLACTSAAANNPTLIPGIVDFASGFFDKGPPPMSIPGVAGSVASNVYDAVSP